MTELRVPPSTRRHYHYHNAIRVALTLLVYHLISTKQDDFIFPFLALLYNGLSSLALFSITTGNDNDERTMYALAVLADTVGTSMAVWWFPVYLREQHSSVNFLLQCWLLSVLLASNIWCVVLSARLIRVYDYPAVIEVRADRPQQGEKLKKD